MRRLVIILSFFICVNAFSRDWTKVINAIATVESNNNPKAIGGGGSIGLLQIRPVLVRDCNEILRKKKINKCYTLNDRYSPSKSKEMFIIIQEHYNPSSNVEKAIRIWNGGPRYSVKKTQTYYNKVLRHMS